LRLVTYETTTSMEITNTTTILTMTRILIVKRGLECPEDSGQGI
jgi:hypothetical protein